MAVTAATYRLPAVTAAHLSSGSGRRIFNTGIANKLYEVCTAGFLSFTNYSLFFFPVSCVSAAEMSETRKRKQADSAPPLSKQPISSRSGLLVRYLRSKIKKLYIGKRFLVQCGYSLLSTQSSLCLILTDR